MAVMICAMRRQRAREGWLQEIDARQRVSLRFHVAVLTVLCLTAWHAPAQAAGADTFVLKVMLDGPDSVAIHTRIALGKPFEYSEMRNGEKITLRGELSPPRKDSYHLRLTIVEWRSNTNNLTTTFEPELVLDKPWSGGVIVGIIHQYTVLLARDRAPENEDHSRTP